MSVVLMEVNVTLVDDEQCPKEKSFCSKGKIGPRQVWTFNMDKQTLVICDTYSLLKSLHTVCVLPGRLWWSVGL